MERSTGVAVRTDLLSKYSRNGTESDLVRSRMRFSVIFGMTSHNVVFRFCSMRLGRSWLRMKRVFSERRGLTSPADKERPSKVLERGSEVFSDLKKKV